MTNKNLITFLIILIFIILLAVALLISIFIFNAHEKIGQNFKIINNIIRRHKVKNNDYKISQYKLPKEKKKKDKSTDINDEKSKIEEDETKKIDIEKKKKTYKKKKTIKKDYTSTKKQQKIIEQKNKIYTQNNNKNYKESKYSKGSSLPDQNFHSYGEYISVEEKEYRTTLIKNLKVKTIVIDKLTNGNGVSQEFFKVVYLNNMIPAKILEEIVESKEFRNIIPNKYLSNEIKTKGLPKGEKIIFDGYKIRELLIHWSYGRLTPIQKAWIVKAEK